MARSKGLELRIDGLLRQCTFELEWLSYMIDALCCFGMLCEVAARALIGTWAWVFWVWLDFCEFVMLVFLCHHQISIDC